MIKQIAAIAFWNFKPHLALISLTLIITAKGQKWLLLFLEHSFIPSTQLYWEKKTTYTFAHLDFHIDINYSTIYYDPYFQNFWGNPQGQVLNFFKFY